MNFLTWGFFGARYLHVVRSVAEQASKSDGIGDRAQIDEQNSGQGLDMQRVAEVAGKKRQLPLDVQDEASAKPKRNAIILLHVEK